jgi:hypothetical protein
MEMGVIFGCIPGIETHTARPPRDRHYRRWSLSLPFFLEGAGTRLKGNPAQKHILCPSV